MPDTLKYIDYTHASPPRAILIWLHGLGASGHDFATLVSDLPLPAELSLRFVFPHAPKRPITINGGMRMPGWYDILGLTRDTTEDRAGIIAGAAQVDALINAERARYPGLPVMLGGFSQGGALALYCGLRQRQPLAGVMGLSCYLPLASETPPAGASSASIFLGHGRDDELVPAAWGKEASELLQQHGYTVEWREYPLGHSVSAAELIDLGRFVAAALPPKCEL